MSNDLIVQSIAAVRTAGDAASETKIPATQPLPQAEPVTDPSPILNPTLRLDPALGLVVIEFRNDSGAITTSIPSQRQLEAYQKWDVTRIGPTPAGIARHVTHAAPARVAVSTPAPATEPRERAPPAKQPSSR
jgi:hypothetical protein